MPTAVYSLDQIAAVMRDWDGRTWTWPADATISYNVQGLTPAAQKLARIAFQLWDEVSNLTFREVTGGGDIMLDDANSGAYGGPRGTYDRSDPNALHITSASVNVQQNWSGESSPGVDSYTLQTFLHEIGHALGMNHSGDYSAGGGWASGLYANDTWQYTVMSYYGQNNYDGGSYRYVKTPMAADIYYMQTVYGAPTDTRPGDTVYGFNSNAGKYQGFKLYDFGAYGKAPAFTIFDSGGSDTINASLYGQNQRIDLDAASFSDIGGLNNNIAIAHNTVVENAIGGSGADTLLGNDADNRLVGNDGNDLLQGGAGLDTLIGGNGADTLEGGFGRDRLTGSPGADCFVFHDLKDSATRKTADVITDFEHGSDRIDLHGLGFSSIVGALSGAAGELVVSLATNTLLSGDLDGDGRLDFFVTLKGAVTLTAADFIL
jgi:serralysin